MLHAPVTAYIGIGANLGDAQQAVRQAIEDLGRLPGVQLRATSSLYRTAPIDSSGPDYINAVAQVDTTLCAPDLLRRLQALEQGAGRDRPYRNAPRTLDLDLLLYGDARIAGPELTVPHPRMWERAFVVVPLADVAPGMLVPEVVERVADQRIEKLGGGPATC
ncbi:MAG: 2-amino-4-hydroxy-6-hydroxymethyldihydropteridine diphosphokinase [Burkholderiales bacterium PBB4]|nr:MAG: 2-amino-4-hydroxy-6-hydroxymethyldihydropteridine diphosphokinase [Burkholderiales bacterium PBB4]